ncbi:MAG: GNAT family N-acetyltransferase [Actinomycetes bacterium]
MPTDAGTTTLDDGALVRGARDTDLAEMLALEAEREGEDDAVDLKLVAETPGGLESMSVVELDGRVVSMATLLDESLNVGGTTLPAGQIEMVATARQAEGRGYVRALMQRSHALSALRGHVVQVMIGIPNFYRQFGYAYSIQMHPWATVGHRQLAENGLATVTASEADLTECQRLQSETQAHFDVTMPHSQDCWRWLMLHTSSQQVLVRDSEGQAHALARVYDDGEGHVDVGEISATSERATDALLAHALRAAGEDGTLRVNLRPHVPGLSDKIEGVERTEWYYVRVPDPAVLLQAMAPVLLARLRQADRLNGEALISFFRRHVRINWANDDLTVSAGGPLQAPVYAGGSGVPIDALGSMLFGDGAEGLEDRFPDAHLGRQADLMRILFPPQSADLLTFYLPS